MAAPSRPLLLGRQMSQMTTAAMSSGTKKATDAVIQ